jgi:2-polyprenyl-6-methoxyphenol hydroxylase-like FAD-dependent oxidoreductase
MRVLIAGGGIAGLVAALALHRKGIDCTVFESVPEIRALGVGINLLPHAVKVLTELDLADALGEVAIRTAELAYFNKLGQRIWSEPRGLAAGYAWPQFSIHRGRLQMVLLDAVQVRLGREHVRTGHHLSDFTDLGDRVAATFTGEADGTKVATESGDALVGADGIHSVVRRRFYPAEGVPRFSGRILWRATTESAPFLGGRTMIMAGHQNQKFVCYPICPDALARGRSLTNWIAEFYVGGDEPPMRRDWNRRADKASFAPLFRSWRFDWLDVPALIDGAVEVFEYPLVDRDPLPRWSFGRISMLGDAAHPMFPIGSNGASQAILDAQALADALAAERNVETALTAYDWARRPPTGQIVLSNRQNGPEQVMQIAEERAPNGFTDIDAVVPLAEREAIAARYKQVAGFDKQSLGRRT